MGSWYDTVRSAVLHWLLRLLLVLLGAILGVALLLSSG